MECKHERTNMNVNITIITAGKLKEKYLKQGMAEYLKRLSKYAKINIVEVQDEKTRDGMTDVESEAIRKKEGDRILAHVRPDTYVITLEIEGRMLSSPALAQKIDDLATYGKSKVAFVIGGSLGLSKAVRKRSNFALSFGNMTLPHQLMRLVLVEQIYRSFRINRGEPYHK